MTCKNCIGYEYCNPQPKNPRNVERWCDKFKNKADFVEMACYREYGYVVFPPDEVFEVELDKAKSFVLSKIIEFMKREAEENPDFFIVGREASGDPLTRNSVGLKVYLPKRKG